MSNEGSFGRFPAVNIAWMVINILWYLGIVGLALFAIIAVIALAGGTDVTFEFPLNATTDASSLPYYLDLMHDSDGPKIVRFDKAVLHGSLKDFDFDIRLLIFLILSFGIAAFLLIVFNLKNFIASVRDGQPFILKNPRRLSIIAYVLILVGPIVGILQYILSGALIPHKPPAVELGASFDLHLITVVIGLIIMVIASVFEAGVRLQQDRDLTI